MNIDLTGRVALVTGSTGGIGFAVARGLLAVGAEVIVNGRDGARVQDAIARLGHGANGVVADLGTRRGHAALVSGVGHVDIVVSNLGVFKPVDFFEADDAEWNRHWQVNVMAGVRLAREFLPPMAERGWGRFLFLGSESAFNIPVEMIHYGVTKTADVALARGLAKRMAGTGVTVNSVLPGPTLSKGVEEMLKGETARSGRSIVEVADDFVRAHRSGSLIRRAASVDEVANMVVYLASPAASATTGAAVRVDGGVIDSI